MTPTARRVTIVLVLIVIGVAVTALIVSKFREATFYPG
jgi:hypothetical protein